MTCRVGPDGRVAQSGVDARAARQLGADAGGENSESGKTAGGQRREIDLGIVEHVAVGGVYRVHQRRGFHLDGFSGLAHLKRGIHGGRAIGLHRDVLRLLHLEAFGGVGERIGSNGQIHKGIDAGAVGLYRARERGLFAQHRD